MCNIIYIYHNWLFNNLFLARNSKFSYLITPQNLYVHHFDADFGITFEHYIRVIYAQHKCVVTKIYIYCEVARTKYISYSSIYCRRPKSCSSYFIGKSLKIIVENHWFKIQKTNLLFHVFCRISLTSLCVCVSWDKSYIYFYYMWCNLYWESDFGKTILDKRWQGTGEWK